MNDNFITIDGIRTLVVRHGSGMPLLLVHGLGGPGMWQSVVEPLAQSFRVMAVDLPGFGESDCPRELLSAEQYAEFLIHLLDALAARKCVVVGTSYGGQIAATLAHDFPSRIERLVLIASTGLGKNNWFAQNNVCWSIVASLLKYTLLRSRWMVDWSSRRSFYDIAQRPVGLVDRFYQYMRDERKREVWLHTLRNVLSPTEGFCQRLAELHVPTLLLWGAKDRAVSTECANEFCRLIPHATLKVFPECSHSVALEKPEELVDEIVTFTLGSTSGMLKHLMDDII